MSAAASSAGCQRTVEDDGSHIQPQASRSQPDGVACIALVNPNTSEATTRAMVEIAHDAANALGLSMALRFVGVTAPFGEPLIANPTALSTACEAVASLAPQLERGFDAVIVAAFGDPGRAQLATTLAAFGIPVVGIGQASMDYAAAKGDGRFVVAQTIPELNESITALARSYGHAEALISVRSPDGDGAALMRDAGAVERELEALVSTAIEEDRVRAVVIGGGPLARAARALSGRFRGCAIVEPIPVAVALVTRLLTEAKASSR